MKIGIGICTTPKRTVDKTQYLKYCTSNNIYLIINSDDKGLGAPSSRNYCIKKIIDEGCDIGILFDDDCYPVMYGFDTYIAENMLKYDLHFVGMPNPFKDKLMLWCDEEITFWNGQLGSFSAFTRKHIETVGYYNTQYERYGFTDPPYTYRSKISPLSKNKSYYTSLLRIPFYIRSEDAYHLNPTPNFSVEEKKQFIQNNKQIYNQEIKEAKLGKIYYPYTHK